MARTKSGSLRKRGEIWWIRYYRNGRRFEESANTTKESEARKLLRLRLGDVERGLPVGPQINRLRFEDGANDVLNDYRANGKRSLSSVERRINKHLAPYFGGRRMASITTSDVRSYIAHRQQSLIVVRKGHGADDVTRPVSNAEINRELAALKRMFSLAVQAGKLLQRPHIPLLREDNVRTGFFEREQFLAVQRHLPAPIRPVAHFAFVTGWRIPSEVLTLQWSQVDFKERLSPNQQIPGTVRLERGKTKNGEARVFPFTADLRDLLLVQDEERKALQKRGVISPWVFHRDGERIQTFAKGWRTACRLAGCPGRIPHDFRRTAVRNLVRKGIPERVAMQLTGHKTRSVFERYNIVSDGDLAAAAARLDEVPAVAAAQ